jgi:hypothetical protein
MGEVIGFPIALDSDLGRQLVVDCARFQEGIVDEKAIRKKYRFDEAAWDALGNDEFVRAVEEESLRRVRNGDCKREKAQQLVTKAPGVLGDILMDAGQSARHRIDSAKVLNDFAANGPQGAPAGDRFIISIVLNGDVERYDKSIEINPNDRDPHHPDDRVFPANVVKKLPDDGNGEPV